MALYDGAKRNHRPAGLRYATADQLLWCPGCQMPLRHCYVGTYRHLSPVTGQVLWKRKGALICPGHGPEDRTPAATKQSVDYYSQFDHVARLHAGRARGGRIVHERPVLVLALGPAFVAAYTLGGLAALEALVDADDDLQRHNERLGHRPR